MLRNKPSSTWTLEGFEGEFRKVGQIRPPYPTHTTVHSDLLNTFIMRILNTDFDDLSSSPLAKKWNFVLTWYNEQAYYNQKVTQISLCMSSLQKWPPYLTMTNENKNFKLGHFGITVQPSDWPWWNLPITTTWSEKIIQIIFFLLMKLWTHTLLANFSTVINCNYSQRA